MDNKKEIPCYGCQGGGCAVCNGYGTLFLEPIKNCKCIESKHNYPEMIWCDECGLEIKDKEDGNNK